ncbi:MAG: hypothetical protein ACREER_02015 [Alphaproteobacteria bacterium]
MGLIGTAIVAGLKAILGWLTPLWLAFRFGQKSVANKALEREAEQDKAALDAAVKAPSTRDDVVDRLRHGGM